MAQGNIVDVMKYCISWIKSSCAYIQMQHRHNNYVPIFQYAPFFEQPIPLLCKGGPEKIGDRPSQTDGPPPG